jgi:hypothetical protein
MFIIKADWPGVNTTTNDDIAHVWERIEAERLAKVVFYDGYINDLVAFTDWVRLPANHFGFVYDKEIPLAVFWVNNHSGLAGMIHFAFFKAGHSNRLDVGRLVLGMCFKGGLSSLYGLTPALYAGALAYIQELGFKLLGLLPGSCEFRRGNNTVCRDGVLSVITANDMR